MPENLPLDILDQVQIASPCSMRWEDMDGDDRVRHCDACKLNVYNIAALSRDEANALLTARLGPGARFCGRIYRREDGTILTRDCPVGWRAARARVVRGVARMAAAIVAIVSGAALYASGRDHTNDSTLRSARPFRHVVDVLAPGTVAPPVVMGEMVIPNPPPNPNAPNPPIIPGCATPEDGSPPSEATG